MDIPSLFFVEATILFLFGVIMVVDSIGQSSQSGNYWVAASNFCGAIGLLLRPLFPRASPIVVQLVPNFLLFMELSLLNKAIAEFVGHGRKLWLAFAGLAVLMTGASTYAIYWHPNPTMLAQFISIVTASVPGCSAALLFRYASPRIRIPMFSMATFFGLYTLNNLLRLGHDWVVPAERFYHILFDRTILAGLSVGYLLMSEASLRHRLQDRANLDPLTGLLNRRALEGDTTRMVERSRHAGEYDSALIIDIDHFKSINDVYGHHAGDAALKVLADALRSTMRESDPVIRLGGDEFLVLLYGAPAAQARDAAERLRNHLASLHVSTDTGEFSIKTSIGIATLARQELSLDELLKTADRNLYIAKSGRPEMPTVK